MRRAALVTATALCLLGMTAEISLISQGFFGPGDVASGLRSDPFSFSFSTAPVANDGTVFFISQATNLDIDASFESGQDWDIFTWSPGGEPAAVSLRVDADPGVREGQATAVAFATNLLASIRDNTLVAPTSQHLTLRSIASLGTPADIATGSSEFFHPRFSRNGSFLVFAANDNSNDLSDSNERRDIFVHSVASNSLARLSVRPLSPLGHIPRDALFPDISDDGQHVVFESGDAAFVPNDNNLSTDIFYLNRHTGAFTRLNTRRFDAGDGRGLETGPCHQPTIDGAATTILFTSADPAIVLGDNNDANDVFAYNIASGQTRRISASDGKAEGSSEHPQINQSGRFIVFRSDAANFPNANGKFQIYLFDAASDSLETVSLNAAGAPANADCFAPAISPDGRYITFSSEASNLDAAVNGLQQLYFADRGPAFLNIRPQAVSIDTHCGINASCPLDLAGSDAESAENTLGFRFRNLPSPEQGTIRLLFGGNVTTTDSYTRADFPIVFVPASDYVGSSILQYEVIDEDGAVSLPATISIFVNDFSNGIIELVSVGDRAFGTPDGQRRAMRGQRSADSPVFSADSVSISADGRFAAFASEADNLTSESRQGIFLRDIADRRSKLIEPIVGGMLVHKPTLSASGNALLHVQIGTPTVLIHHRLDAEGNPIARRSTTAAANFHVPQSLAISEDGNTVLFASPDQLAAGDDDAASDIFAWQPDTDSLVLVSSETLACTQPSISPDGNWAAFVLTESANSVIRLVHLQDGSSETVGEEGVDLTHPSLSRSGRYLAAQAGPSAIILDRDTNTRTVANSATNVAISASGRFLYFTDNQARRLDWGSGASRLISNNADALITAGALNGSGTAAIFATTAANLMNDSDTRSDVFTIDLGAIQNFPPTATDSAVTMDEDSDKVIALLVADPEGDDMLIEIVQPPAHGSLSPIASGSLTYTPDPDYAGSDSFSWRAHDSSAFSREATVAIAVTNLNDAPRLDPIADHAADEGQTISFTVPVSDPDPGDILSFIPTHGNVTNGNFSFIIPHGIATEGNDPAALLVSLRVSDLAGASVSQTFTITVSDVNVPPVASSASLTPAIPRTTDDLILSYVYEDFDGDPQGATRIVWYRDSAEFASDTLTIPAANTQSGQQWFAEITPLDERGGTGATVTLPTVTITNSVPQVTPRTEFLDEDGSVTVTLSASDDDGDSLTITHSAPSNGRLNGLTYIPDANFFGTDSFTYTASDGADSASATITLIVAAQPDPPILTVSDSFIHESANSAILAISLRDPDEPGGITAASYTLTFSVPTTGELQGVSGPITADALPITFIPDGVFTDETITVVATDPSGRSSGVRDLRIVNNVRFQSLVLQAGWNLVCLTRDPLDFPFDNALGWDPDLQEFRALETAARGEGFWTHAARPTTLLIPGWLSAATPLPVKAGWNLIGGIGEGDFVAIPNAADIAWRWEKRFLPSDVIDSGEAAWIYFAGDGNVDIELLD